MIIKIADLEKFVKKILLTEYSSKEADMIKDVILFAEISGRHSHGIIRLIKGNYGPFVDGKRGKIEYFRRTRISTLIDGKGNPGMLIGPLATQEAIKLAKKNGIGIVGTKGSVSSTGALSFYCKQIADANFIGVIFTQASPTIAPFNTKVPLFGTNPIGFAIPSDPDPIIFDMSTSAITMGMILKHKAEGKNLPENVAIDENGDMTIDPEKAMNGATLAFDGSYKGSGLAMIVEMFGAVWSGGSFAGTSKIDGSGNLFMVLSPDLITDVKTMRKRMKIFIKTVKSAPTKDNKEVRIPGESTLSVWRKNLAAGEVEVSDIIMKKIQTLG